jgi:murein L,D-transpeptidase YafK
MALYGGGEWNKFWRDLKAGHDLFEQTRLPPAISICEGRYVARKASASQAGVSVLASDCSRRLSAR